MEEKKNKKAEALYPGFFLGLLIMLVVFLLIGSAVWGAYRDQLMGNQKDQMLLTAQTLADNISLSLTEYKDDLEFLSTREFMENEGKIYNTFLESQSKYECNLFWENEKGIISKSIYDLELSEPVFISQISDDMNVWQYTASGEDLVLVFKKKLASGEQMGLVIDAEKYYQQLISDIHIGTNGYIVVKNSEGIIIMHPEKDQWGIHVINGRKLMYPELDYESLDAMTRQQQTGEEGISEYYSYWWSNPELSQVRKISAYSPAQIGDDFWIISAVVDYDDFYEPVEAGFRRLTLVFVVAALFFLLLFLYIGKLIFEQRKATAEIESLLELNERLEEVHRGQEMLAHQQRLQVMGTMTGGIAHEFNNFLTPIMGYAELLMLDLPEESDAYDSAVEIYEATEKAKEMVRQISSLSRRNVETVYKLIDTNKMMLRAMKMIQSICPTNIHIEKEFEINEEQILGNATQIDQVLLNICVNAFHAIGNKEGKLLISVKCKEKEVLEENSKVSGLRFSDEWRKYLCIDIADSGCGMDADTLRQIFDPFFTTKKTGEGTGLGLALAEQIIMSHKGHIYAESELGKGTTFHIVLPIVEKNTSINLSEMHTDEKLKIVIADDNAKVLQLLEKNFLRLGMSIITCRDKRQLQNILDSERVDVLVIDESLMDVNGIEFLMAMQGKYPEMFKFIMVDYFTKEIVEAKHMGIIDAYLTKPISDTIILEAIRNCRKVN